MLVTVAMSSIDIVGVTELACIEVVDDAAVVATVHTVVCGTEV